MVSMKRTWTEKTYSRTIETTPETAELLDYLIDRHIVPVMNRRIAQGSLMTGRKKLSPQKELELILGFGSGSSNPVRRASEQPRRNVAQASANAATMSSKEVEQMRRIIEFGSGKRTK